MKIHLNEMSKPIKILFTALFAAYLLLLLYLTFFSKYYGRGEVQRSISIFPFRTISEFLTSGYNFRIIITNLVGNIVAFMPMGFLLPIAFSRLDKFHKVLVISLFATLMIEVSQYISGVGASDIDDVILNLLGAVIGYGICMLTLKILRK